MTGTVSAGRVAALEHRLARVLRHVQEERGCRIATCRGVWSGKRRGKGSR
jgi:hypothetical protein